jgi:hypothetical protein
LGCEIHSKLAREEIALGTEYQLKSNPAWLQSSMNFRLRFGNNLKKGSLS